MQLFRIHRLAFFTVAFTLGLLAWDASGLDLALARWAGGPAGFPLREQWFLVDVMHDGGRRLAWALALLLCLLVWWPVGNLVRLPYRRRFQLALTPLLCVMVVSAFKFMSKASCPWSLTEFGGVARYASHWTHLFEPDGGSGACFPAGHASSGFAFVGGYFAFRREAPGLARGWLVASGLAGLVLGLAQQLRGAHFLSHTLWTALLCWMVAWALDGALARPGLAMPGLDMNGIA